MTDDAARQCRCCRVSIRVGMLACRNHWFMLPVELRDAILVTYRGGDREAYVANVHEADRLWLEAGVFVAPPKGNA
jgi:hypothetical protein